MSGQGMSNSSSDEHAKEEMGDGSLHRETFMDLTETSNKFIERHVDELDTLLTTHSICEIFDEIMKVKRTRFEAENTGNKSLEDMPNVFPVEICFSTVHGDKTSVTVLFNQTKLPDEWEQRFDCINRPYFVNHMTKQTQWEDPRLGTTRYNPNAGTPGKRILIGSDGHVSVHDAFVIGHYHWWAYKVYEPLLREILVENKEVVTDYLLPEEVRREMNRDVLLGDTGIYTFLQPSEPVTWYDIGFWTAWSGIFSVALLTAFTKK